MRLSNLLTIVSLFASMMISSVAHALPVLDANTPNSETLTIYPDSENKNLYYLMPKMLEVARDHDGTPMFSYMEVGHFLSVSAIVQLSLTPSFDEQSVQKAKQEILARNPGAQFASVVFHDSKVIFSTQLAGLVESSDCNHAGGVVGAEVTCTLRLSPRGRTVMLGSFRKKATIYINFEYSVAGVERDGKGNDTGLLSTWDVTGAIGSKELANFPELFLNSRGKVIRFRSAPPSETKVRPTPAAPAMSGDAKSGLTTFLPSCGQATSELRAQLGFKCKTRSGWIFERVAHDGFGEAWRDPDRVIWSESLGNKTWEEAKGICQSMGANLPEENDLSNCAGRGCAEVLSKMSFEFLIWSIIGKRVIGDGYVFTVAPNDAIYRDVEVRCIVHE